MLYTIQLNLLLASIDGDISSMRDIANMKMRDWLLANCGTQGVNWRFKPRLNVFKDKTHGMEIKIEDQDAAMMFRLAFSEYLNQDVDLSAK